MAISTTGDEHRLDLLAQSVDHWDKALFQGDSLFVTVDGDAKAVRRVEQVVGEWTASVARVGQPTSSWSLPLGMRGERLGVAANKNTGLEYLMDNTQVEHLWLSDDDSWPLGPQALQEHFEMGLPHSMVCWGRHRRGSAHKDCAAWTWPRGSVLYATREVVTTVGGMIEAFGPGGHEHVEWSRRIHQHGFTPQPYVSPESYTHHNYLGAAAFWHCEDMPLRGEPLGNLRMRRRELTSVRREPEDGALQSRIMATMDGDTRYVPFRASENRRASATMSHT